MHYKTLFIITLLTFNGVSVSNKSHNVFRFEMIFSQISPHHFNIIFWRHCCCKCIPSAGQQNSIVTFWSTTSLSDWFRCDGTTFCVQTPLIQWMFGQWGWTFSKTSHSGLAFQQLCSMSAIFRKYGRNEIDVAPSLSPSILKSVCATATFLSYCNAFPAFEIYKKRK